MQPTMDNTDFDRHVAEARKRVAELDAIDQFQDRTIPAIIAALETGLKRPETGAQFDALVMLHDIAGQTQTTTRQQPWNWDRDSRS